MEKKPRGWMKGADVQEREKKAPEEYKTRSLEWHPVKDKKNGAVLLDWGRGEESGGVKKGRVKAEGREQTEQNRAEQGGGDGEIGMGGEN